MANNVLNFLASKVARYSRIPVSRDQNETDETNLDPSWIDRTTNVILDTVTISDTINENTVLTEPINASTMYKGQIIVLWACGQFSTANSSVTYTIRLKMGATTLATVVTDAKTVSDRPWEFEYKGTVRAINGDGYISSHVTAQFDDIFTHYNNKNQNFNTDLAQDLTLTIQPSETGVDNNIEIDQGFMQFLGVKQS